MKVKGKVKGGGSGLEEKRSSLFFHPCWCCLVLSNLSFLFLLFFAATCSRPLLFHLDSSAMAALAMEIQNWEPLVSWGRRWGQVGAWGEEVGGQEGVRVSSASGGEARARDILGTASSVWLARSVAGFSF